MSTTYPLQVYLDNLYFQRRQYVISSKESIFAAGKNNTEDILLFRRDVKSYNHTLMLTPEL